VRDGLVRLAVLGDPLSFTLSPALHRAGLESIGLACESRAIRTTAEQLGPRLDELAAAGYRGVNLTAPLKEEALRHLTRVSDPARRARSANTVGFEPEARWGDTTDGAGFVTWLRTLGRIPKQQSVVFFGAGGAVRSLALALAEAGCDRLTVCARRPDPARSAWSEISDVTWASWDSAATTLALAAATLVVHGTPLDDPGIALVQVPDHALIIDLRYAEAPMPWVSRARAAGFEAWDGLGLLVFQAQRSLALWTGGEIAIDPLARAVGWPR
jgi:shikimate dehydrogenase